MDMDNIKINWAPVLESQIASIESRFPDRHIREMFQEIIDDLNENRVKSRLIVSGNKPAGYAYYRIPEKMSDRVLGNVGFVDADSASSERAENLLQWLITEATSLGRFVMINDIFNGNSQTSAVMDKLGFNRVEREMMYLPLGNMPASGSTLPEGYTLETMDKLNIQEYITEERKAYSGSSDEILFPSSDEEQEEFTRGMFEGSYGRVLPEISRIAMKDGRLVGSCVVSLGPNGEVTGGYPLILDIFTSAEHRGKGIAKVLILEAARRSSAAGYGNLYLWVNMKNEARKVYESIGFRSSGYEKEIFFYLKA